MAIDEREKIIGGWMDCRNHKYCKGIRQYNSLYCSKCNKRIKNGELLEYQEVNNDGNR